MVDGKPGRELYPSGGSPPCRRRTACGQGSQGDSALTSAMRLAMRYKEMRPLRDLVSRYASAGEINDAKKAAAKTVRAEKDNRFWKTLSWNLPPTLIALVFPLAIGGLSIFTREKLFASDKSQNLIMGRVSGLLVLCVVGFFFWVL